MTRTEILKSNTGKVLVMAEMAETLKKDFTALIDGFEYENKTTTEQESFNQCARCIETQTAILAVEFYKLKKLLNN